jgi:hypothetical protein
MITPETRHFLMIFLWWLLLLPIGAKLYVRRRDRLKVKP